MSGTRAECMTADGVVWALQDGKSDWPEFLNFFEKHFQGVVESERIEQISDVSVMRNVRLQSRLLVVVMLMADHCVAARHPYAES